MTREEKIAEGKKIYERWKWKQEHPILNGIIQFSLSIVVFSIVVSFFLACGMVLFGVLI